jgi:hypothetical protein
VKLAHHVALEDIESYTEILHVKFVYNNTNCQILLRVSYSLAPFNIYRRGGDDSKSDKNINNYIEVTSGYRPAVSS